MESKGFEYFAFISYSHKDQELAKRLKKRLQSYHLPSRLRKSYPGLPKKLRPVFLDESSLVSIDESLQKSLYINLDNSNYLIVICSPNSAQSVYVNDEVKHFIETGKMGHIVPLIVEGVPHSGDEATECFPPAIRNLPREQELLGVDLTKFGERDAFLRVIATMLGLNLDRFVQDEERERRRRAVRLASMAAALVMMVGTMVWYSIYRAEKRRNEGEEQNRRGVSYYNVRDYAKAREWFEKAAENGNASAQNNLGRMYYHALGVETDYAKAIAWYEKAAANGNSYAQYSIGYMYENGQGVKKNYAKAMECFKKAAANDDSYAQYSIGNMHYHGQGVKRDYAKAAEWYKKAATNGYSDAQYMIGYMFQHGKGVKQNYVKAMEWYEKAANNGSSYAQYSIGKMYYSALGVKQNYAQAAEWYEKAAAQGYSNAQYMIGSMHYYGRGVKQDYAKAAEWYEKAAVNGNANAQFFIGYMYHCGQGIETNYAKAAEWYEKAAAQGNSGAQNNIGTMYYSGLGIEQDYAQAMKWYEKAATSGNSNAQYMIGYMYQYGESVKQDYAKAAEWYEKAAAQRNSSAQFSLGNIYQNGLGVKTDYAKAMEWYEKAASQGHANAQFTIGYMYYEGLGVKQDYAKAMEWYEKAAARGDASAQYNLGYMYEHGQGGKQDYFKAMELYQKAADKRNAKAQDAIDRARIALQNIEGQIPYEWISNLVQNPYSELRRIRTRPDDKKHGFEVQWIQNDSLLKRLGVQRGDIILSVNGTRFLSISDIVNSLESSDRFDIELMRGGENITLRFVIKNHQKYNAEGNAKARDAFVRVIQNIARVVQNTEGHIPYEWINNLVQNPFDEMKRIRIRPNEKVGGLEVQWIQNDSLLKRLGVQRGDIIRSVNDTPFTNMGDIMNSINSLTSSERLNIELMRGGENITLRYVIKK